MATYNKFNSFVEDLAHGVHDFSSDSLKVALSNTAPTASNSTLADITEIAYTNISSRDLTINSEGQSGGTYNVELADLVLDASGGDSAQFKYVVIYNDTSTNDNLIGWYEYGGSNPIELLDGESLTLDFSQADGLFDLS